MVTAGCNTRGVGTGARRQALGHRGRERGVARRAASKDSNSGRRSSQPPAPTPPAPLAHASRMPPPNQPDDRGGRSSSLRRTQVRAGEQLSAHDGTTSPGLRLEPVAALTCRAANGEELQTRAPGIPHFRALNACSPTGRRASGAHLAPRAVLLLRPSCKRPGRARRGCEASATASNAVADGSLRRMASTAARSPGRQAGELAARSTRLCVGKESRHGSAAPRPRCGALAARALLPACVTRSAVARHGCQQAGCRRSRPPRRGIRWAMEAGVRAQTRGRSRRAGRRVAERHPSQPKPLNGGHASPRATSRAARRWPVARLLCRAALRHGGGGGAAGLSR